MRRVYVGLFCLMVIILGGCHEKQQETQSSIEETTTELIGQSTEHEQETNERIETNPEETCLEEEQLALLKESLSDLVESKVDEIDFKGAIRISYKDQIIFDNCYGFADTLNQIPHADETQYMVASMNKQVTAMCIMLLEEQGKLSVDDPVDQYYTGFPSGVTIHHLITHSSGLPVFSPLDQGETLQEQIQEGVENGALALVNDPGTEFVYSDTGYVVLSGVIELASGMDYDDFVKETIFEPLEMKDSGFGYDRTMNPNLAIGYGADGSTLKDPSSLEELRYGAGALYVTMDDFYKWDRALFHNTLLSEEGMQRMWTDYGFGYGYGFFLSDGYPEPVIAHGGRLISRTFSGFNIRYPENQISIIILGNDGDHDPKRDLCYEILNRILYHQNNDYMGQIPPDQQPVVFAPGFVSTEEDELTGVFTPDGLTFFYTVRDGWEEFRIYQMDKLEASWSEPHLAAFSSDYMDSDPFVAADGNAVYFCSTRPSDPADTTEDWNIWVSEKEGDLWLTPTVMPFCTEEDEMYVSVSEEGDVYFYKGVPGEAQLDIYVSEVREGTYSTPISLDEAINSAGNEYDPFISPDGSYLVFTSTKSDPKGVNGDLFISFLDENGVWKEAVSMGDTINSPYFDYCLTLTPDGQFFIFSSYRNNILSSGDIFWMSSDIVDDYR